MLYTYSICHPLKKAIEYKNDPIQAQEVISIAKNYPWIEQLSLKETHGADNILYSPSLEFSIEGTEHRFNISGLYTNQYDSVDELKFLVSYNRPKMTKILFGLLGEKEKMCYDDVGGSGSGIPFKQAIQYLQYFVDQDYDQIEKLFDS